MRKTFASLLSLILISCGGGSSSNPVKIDVPNTPSIVNPTNPLIWENVTPESVGMNSSYLDSAIDYAFQDGSYTQAVVVIKDGKLIAERAKEAGVSSVVFDRGGFLYHGRVKALADSAREAGLNF